MRKNDLSSSIRSFFAPRKNRLPDFVPFRDSLENFGITYPAGWRFDQDMAIVEGRYTISFQSPDGQCQFTVAVDAQLPWSFDFAKYAKDELESPSAGIYAEAKKGSFRGMEAYRREYSYRCGREYFGGGIMFFNRDCVFSLSWSGPEARREELQPIFDRMLESIMIKETAVRAPAAKKPSSTTKKPRAKEPRPTTKKRAGRTRRKQR